jgi:hypothetical protein
MRNVFGVPKAAVFGPVSGIPDDYVRTPGLARLLVSFDADQESAITNPP